MRHRTVSDLMTRPVVRVQRDTDFQQIAELLAEHDITAVPVVDDCEYPVGIVSEADLLHGQAQQPDPTGLPTPPRPLAGSSGGSATRTARTAGELMTSPAVITRPDRSVVQAARVMERRRVKRLPVVDETEQLVGILSRSDLLHVFLRHDQAIRDEIADDILGRTLGLGPSQVTVTVTDGRVTLQGIVDHRNLLPVVDRLTEGVDGVVEVRDRLACRTNPPTGTALC